MCKVTYFSYYYVFAEKKVITSVEMLMLTLSIIGNDYYFYDDYMRHLLSFHFYQHSLSRMTCPSFAVLLLYSYTFLRTYLVDSKNVISMRKNVKVKLNENMKNLKTYANNIERTYIKTSKSISYCLRLLTF